MTDTRQKTTAAPQQTHDLGAELASSLARGDVVALYGDLGAGKTCMIQGICAGLAVEDPVTSPTFVLINEYRGRLQGARLDVYHLDLYRLGSLDELEELGVEEYFYGDGICLIEWPERAGALLPARRLDVHLAHAGDDRRTITMCRVAP